MKINRITSRGKRGAALVEYGLIVAGVALVAAAAVSIFGHKTATMVGISANMLPGLRPEDNNPIMTGRIIATETVDGAQVINPGPENTFTLNFGVDPSDLVRDPQNNP